MAGDRSGFDDFAASAVRRLLGQAYLLTGDRPAAEDLVQETLERLYVAWPRVDDPMAYARTTLTRRSINRWRWHRTRPEATLDAAPEPAVADGSDVRADRDELVRALAGLPPRQRAVVVLRYLEELTEQETAQVLGCSVGTVKSQAHRALATLRQRLGPAAGLTGGTIDIAGRNR